MKAILAILFFISLNASATNYYFADAAHGGNDGNIGTKTSPWQSITKANSIVVHPGDSILFQRGSVFFGELSNITTSGSPTTGSIHYDAYGGGAQPIITGWTNLSVWTSLGNNIYEAYCPLCSLAPNMVQLNGANQWMGRTPDKGATNDGWNTYTTGTTGYIVDPTLSSLPVSIGALTVIRTNDFEIDTGTIVSLSVDTIKFAVALGSTPTAGFGYYYERDPATLNQLGEWYWNSAVDSLQMEFVGSTPSANSVNIASQDTLFTLLASYITIKNLNFQGASKVGVLLMNNSSHDTIQYCTFGFSGKNLLEFASNHSNCLVDNCYFSDCNNESFPALGSGDNNCVFSNNTIKRIGLITGMGQGAGQSSLSAITLKGIGWKIRNNVIDSCGYNGVEITSANQSDSVYDNFIQHYTMSKNDGGGIYAATVNTSTTIGYIANNIVLNGVGYYFGTNTTVPNSSSGIYLDAGSSYWKVQYNTTAYNPTCGIFLHYSKNQNIQYNNNFANGAGFFYQTESNDSLRNDTVRNNVSVALDSPQVAIMWGLGGRSDYSQWGPIDSNYYERPTNDNLSFWNRLGSYYNLAGWQTLSSLDAHSFTSPISAKNIGYLTLLYNPTSSAGTYLVLGKSVDPYGNSYPAGQITLQPYTSLILIQRPITFTPFLRVKH